VPAAAVEEHEQKWARQHVVECKMQGSVVQFNCRGEYD